MSESIFKNVTRSDYGVVSDQVSIEEEFAEFTEILNRVQVPVKQAMAGMSRAKYLVAGLESSDRDPTVDEVELIDFSLESIIEQLQLSGIGEYVDLSLEADEESKDVAKKGKGVIARSWESVKKVLKRIVEWIKTKFKKIIDVIFGKQRRIDKQLARAKKEAIERIKATRAERGLKEDEGRFQGDPTDIKPWKFLIDTHGKVTTKGERSKYGSKPIIAGKVTITVPIDDGLKWTYTNPSTYTNHKLDDDFIAKLEKVSDLGKKYAEKLKKDEAKHEKVVKDVEERFDDPNNFGDEKVVAEVHAVSEISELLRDGLQMTWLIQHNVEGTIREFNANLSEASQVK